MRLRTRVTLAAGVAVLLAVAAVSVTVYIVVRDNLYAQVDESLRHNGTGQQQHRFPHDTSTAPEHLPLAREVYLQTIDRDGEIINVYDNRPLPVTTEVLAVANGERDEVYFDAEVDGTPVRIYATATEAGIVLQVGRSLTELEQTLQQLVVALLIISAAAVALATLLGRLVAAAAVAPVHHVAEAADAVTRTGDLSHHIPVPGGDDLGRMAASFNTMLDALAASLAQQRQLVADASHELRTPLATVRTNVEVLARGDRLPPDERAALIGDTVAQIEELTRLVGDLMELARGDGQVEPFTLIDLDQLTRGVAEAVGRHHPTVTLRMDGARSLIRGAPSRVSRAVSNLLDNAAKWSPPGAEVQIEVRDGTVRVRDHGPGVDPADLPHIFDRFYRSAAARTLPGAGLGLAIVKQVADSHGGSVTATATPGGGALFTLRFPTVDAAAVTELEIPTGFSRSS